MSIDILIPGSAVTPGSQLRSTTPKQTQRLRQTLLMLCGDEGTLRLIADDAGISPPIRWKMTDATDRSVALPTGLLCHPGSRSDLLPVYPVCTINEGGIDLNT